MASIIKDLEWRYATKKFDDDKILPLEKIEVLKQAFNLTATSYGLQPVQLVIIHNKTLQKKIVEFSYGQKQIASASHILLFCVQTDINTAYITAYFNRIQTIRKTSDKILTPFKDNLIKDFSSKSKEEIFQWAKNQAYLIMGNLLTVCAIEKIDACPMEGFDKEKTDNFLKLNNKKLRSVLMMPIGYRANDDIFSEMKKVRKDMEKSVIEI